MKNNTEKSFGKFMLLWSGDFVSAIGSGLTSFGQMCIRDRDIPSMVEAVVGEEVFAAVYDDLEYYVAAEPPVRCGVSHLSGLTEPLI